MTAFNQQQPQRILVVRLSAIGDVVHGLPVAAAMRDAMPRAQIGWVVEGRTAELLDSHPAVDRVLRLPRGWYRSWSGLRAARKAVRDFAPTITIDLQGLTKSALLAWWSGASQRIGFAGADGREISRLFNNLRVAANATHVVDKNLELLAPLGVTSQPADFRLPVNREAAEQMRRSIQALTHGRPFLLINPGAGWGSKRWPVERWAAVAARMKNIAGIDSLVAWAPGDEESLARAIVSQSQGAARMAPPTTLLELIELSRMAKLFLSGDTGPLHLAAAVGTPCVALFGPSDGRRNGPYGSGHRILQQVRLNGGSRARRNADQQAINAISIEMVVAAAQELLDHRQAVAG